MWEPTLILTMTLPDDDSCAACGNKRHLETVSASRDTRKNTVEKEKNVYSPTHPARGKTRPQLLQRTAAAPKVTKAGPWGVGIHDVAKNKMPLLKGSP